MSWIVFEKKAHGLVLPSMPFASEFAAKRWATNAYSAPVIVSESDVTNPNIATAAALAMRKLARGDDLPNGIGLFNLNGKEVLGKIV